MKRTSVFILCFVGVFALSIGFMKDLQSTEQAFTYEGDQKTVITIEEQEMVEKMVKNMPTGFVGFVPQEEGTGFFFKKAEIN